MPGPLSTRLCVSAEAVPWARSDSGDLSEWTKEVKLSWEGRCFCFCSRSRWPCSALKLQRTKGNGGWSHWLLWDAGVWAFWWMKSLSVFFVKIPKERKCATYSCGAFLQNRPVLKFRVRDYYCKKNQKKTNILYVVIQMNLNQTAPKRGQPFADNLIINQVITLETPTRGLIRADIQRKHLWRRRLSVTKKSHASIIIEVRRGEGIETILKCKNLEGGVLFNVLEQQLAEQSWTLTVKLSW